MNYKSTNLNDLKNDLKEKIVIFDYKKKDGSIRTAKGTLNNNYIPEKNPEQIKFEKYVIDELMKIKNINSIDEYASANGIEFSLTEEIDNEIYYVFVPIKKKTSINENLLSYFDVDKQSFRSFFKDNFIGIIE